MASDEPGETTQIEVETQAIGAERPTEDAPAEVKAGDKEKEPKKKKERAERKEPTILVREPGKSLLPFSRVQKIIRADKDIPIVAKEATFLISLATEAFIRRLSEYAQRTAERERRATVQHKDIATVVRKDEEFLFLEEMIPWTAPSGHVPKKPKTVEPPKAPTMLDKFMKAQKAEENVEGDGGDVVMNEDGTMFAGGEDEGDDEDVGDVDAQDDEEFESWLIPRAGPA